MATVLATRPARRTRFKEKRPARLARASEPAMARATWGMNITPYWLFDRSYPVWAVRMVAAAGKATRLKP
jgi:hypothetical protein